MRFNTFNRLSNKTNKHGDEEEAATRRGVFARDSHHPLSYHHFLSPPLATTPQVTIRAPSITGRSPTHSHLERRLTSAEYSVVTFMCAP